MTILDVRVYRAYAMVEDLSNTDASKKTVHFRKHCQFVGVPRVGDDVVVWCDGKPEKLRVNRVEWLDVSNIEGKSEVNVYTEMHVIQQEDIESLRQRVLPDRWIFTGVGDSPLV